MLKIFLVEDEFVVREGIKKIDWAAHGYEFCGDASDGELALPLIKKLKPDIVITDIKMPFMDGLELSRHIHKDFPNIEIIILSGYEEFGYAKEAISIGVSKYLSKPISANELIAEIDSLKDSIEEKRRESEISERYKKEMEEESINNRIMFFNSLVKGNGTVSELIARGEELEIDLQASAFSIVLCNISRDDESDKIAYESDLLKAIYELAEWTDKKEFYFFDRDLEGQAILYTADSVEELEAMIKQYTDEFIAIVSKYSSLKYYAGIGESVRRISEIPQSYTSASAGYAHRFFDKNSNVIYWNSKNDYIISDTDETDDELSTIDTGVIDRNRVALFLKTGELSEIDYFINEFHARIGDSAAKSNLFRQYLAMDIYFTVTEFVGNLGLDKSEIEQIKPSLLTSDNLDGVREYGKRIIIEAIKLRDSISKNKYKDVVDDVIKFVSDNYSDESLSLNMIAEHIGFSPNHLSMIFSQQMGMTLSKYLIDYRIEKAKEALKCTSLKSSEIAIEVGYKDPHYFSYMFKKITGITPTQYRDGKND